YLIARGDPLGVGGELPLWGEVGLAVSIGCIGGIGINTAHQPGHKEESPERWGCKNAPSPSFYGAAYNAHKRAHHARVTTPPATRPRARCCALSGACGSGCATSPSPPRTPGTPTTSRPTCCSTTCSGTATTTRTPPVATRPCATTRSRRCCRPGTPG